MHVNAAGTDDGKGTHLSVRLHLMKGPHDDKLTWPLRGDFTVTLLNQISDNNHHSVIFPLNNSAAGNRVTNGEYAVRGWGMTTFIANEELHRFAPARQFLKDDCIFFQVYMVRN